MMPTLEALRRLLDYDGRRYWLENGWSVRFRVTLAPVTPERPEGVKYAFTLHDVDKARLLGFDNAHGVPRQRRFDHYHRFGRVTEPEAYEFRGVDQLIGDFFLAVERACRREGAPFEFVDEDLETEGDDETNQPERAP